MKWVKIFCGHNAKDMQNNINRWLDENEIEEFSVKFSGASCFNSSFDVCDDNYSCLIVYESEVECD